MLGPLNAGGEEVGQAKPFAAGEAVLNPLSPRDLCGKEEEVLVGAFQSEREEETRDRAERGSAVRGSDQASVAPERSLLRRTGDDLAGRSAPKTAKSQRYLLDPTD